MAGESNVVFQRLLFENKGWARGVRVEEYNGRYSIGVIVRGPKQKSPSIEWCKVGQNEKVMPRAVAIGSNAQEAIELLHHIINAIAIEAGDSVEDSAPPGDDDIPF